jgi:hypothetical protein
LLPDSLLIRNPLFCSVLWCKVFFEPIKTGVCCWCPGALLQEEGRHLVASSHTQPPSMGREPIHLPPQALSRPQPMADGWVIRWPAGRPLAEAVAREGRARAQRPTRKRNGPACRGGGRSGSNPPPTPATATHTQYPLGCVCRYWLLRWVRLFYMAVS